MMNFVRNFWYSTTPKEDYPYADTDSGGQEPHGNEYEEGSQGGSNEYNQPYISDGQKSGSAKGRLNKPLQEDVEPPELRRRKKGSRQSGHRGARTLEKEIRKAEEELDRLGRTNKELETDSKASKAKIQHMNGVIDNMRRQVLKHETDLHVARDTTLKLEEQSKRQSEELQRLKVELKQVEAHHEQTRQLLEERTKELTGAQKFLTRTDSLSGADVISVVESLNAEILQAAASMAESLEFTYSSHTETQRKAAYDSAAHMIGADMMHVFNMRSTQKPSEFDPTPVQIALQICIAKCCAMIANCWASNTDRLDQSLKEIYKRMCEKEQPAVSGRWRSLTRAQMRNNEDRQGMLSYVISRVIEVLLVAGWSAQGLSATEPVFNSERLVIVVDLALRLNTAIGQDITSVDILPVIIQAGVKFHSKTMEDTYAADVKRGHTQDEDVVRSDLVAGTTDIGLRRISRDIEGGSRIDVLLKPKVILRSAVQEEFLS